MQHGDGGEAFDVGSGIPDSMAREISAVTPGGAAAGRGVSRHVPDMAAGPVTRTPPARGGADPGAESPQNRQPFDPGGIILGA
jgi:hypothetical protein